MLLTLYAKNRTTTQGKPFTIFLATLTRRDGSTITADVRFKQEAGTPDAKKCPVNIEVDKAACNLSTRAWQSPATGEVIDTYKLWVSTWKYSDIEYEDHSLDDIAD